jgi:diphthamide synthase (EF-2-diphthine--ammonia ligase)
MDFLGFLVFAAGSVFSCHGAAAKSAWSLHLLGQGGGYEVVALLATFNREANRVAMHGVRRELVEAQAEAAGVPLWDVNLPSPCSNAEYESIMQETCKTAVHEGSEYVAFGDLFLRDIRKYREKQLEGSGLKPFFLCEEFQRTSLPER